MIVWLMILCMNNLACTQVGPFASEEACLSAGRTAKKKDGGTSYVCVPSDIPPGTAATK